MKDKNELSGVKVEQQAAPEPVIDQNQFIGRIQPDYFHLPGTLVSFFSRDLTFERESR